ncbi:MFS transporter [Chloroflexota bacterium]
MVFESWQKNLYIILAAEFVAMAAFNFVGPFLPLYVQEMGEFTTKEAAFWTGLVSSGLGMGMFLSGPLWGIAADRWGRKLMVLRVMFIGSAVLTLQGLVPNVYWLVALRWGQGLLTGSTAAVSALATSIVPRNKVPLAAGLVMVAVSAGFSLGPIIGGFLSDWIGYRNVFFVIGAILFSVGLIVFMLVREKFEPPPHREALLGSMFRVVLSRDLLPVLILLFALGFGPSMVGPIVPLFIRELNPAGSAAIASGLAFGLMGAVYTLSNLVASKLGERINIKKIMVFSCIGVGLFHLPPMWATTVTQLIIFLVLANLPGGGVSASSNGLVGLSVPPEQQGVAYGLSNSASSLGFGLGPLVGGTLASLWGFKPIFGITAGLSIAVGLLAIKLLPGRLFTGTSDQSESLSS